MVYPVYDGRHRPEVLSNFNHFPLAHNQLFGFFVNFNISPPEAVDGLFGVADDKQFAGSDLHLVPAGGQRFFLRQEENNLGLQGVCLLYTSRCV